MVPFQNGGGSHPKRFQDRMPLRQLAQARQKKTGHQLTAKFQLQVLSETEKSISI